MRRILLALLLACFCAAATAEDTVQEQFAKRAARLWSLQPVNAARCPTRRPPSTNPIDAFIAADLQDKGLHAGRQSRQADAAAAGLLRPDRHSADGRGAGCLPADTLPTPTRKWWTGFLPSEQHGVRWARHWLDVLRYADLDGLDGSVMPAASGTSISGATG